MKNLTRILALVSCLISINGCGQNGASDLTTVILRLGESGPLMLPLAKTYFADAPATKCPAKISVNTASDATGTWDGQSFVGFWFDMTAHNSANPAASGSSISAGSDGTAIKFSLPAGSHLIQVTAITNYNYSTDQCCDDWTSYYVYPHLGQVTATIPASGSTTIDVPLVSMNALFPSPYAQPNLKTGGQLVSGAAALKITWTAPATEPTCNSYVGKVKAKLPGGFVFGDITFSVPSKDASLRYLWLGALPSIGGIELELVTGNKTTTISNINATSRDADGVVTTARGAIDSDLACAN